MGEVERTDGWTEREDRITTKIVLDFIRTGRTQLEAFDLAGDQIGRTQGAVGYRWNAVLRKENIDKVKIAKRERLALKRNKHPATTSTLLSDLGAMETRLRSLISSQKWTEQEIRRLKAENQELKQQLIYLEDFARILNRMNEIHAKGERKK